MKKFSSKYYPIKVNDRLPVISLFLFPVCLLGKDIMPKRTSWHTLHQLDEKGNVHGNIS